MFACRLPQTARIFIATPVARSEDAAAAEVFTNAMTNRIPNTRSVEVTSTSDRVMRPWTKSTAMLRTKRNFSTMPGIIIGRNLSGSDPITRKAICQAIVTARKP